MGTDTEMRDMVIGVDYANGPGDITVWTLQGQDGRVWYFAMEKFEEDFMDPHAQADFARELMRDMTLHEKDEHGQLLGQALRGVLDYEGRRRLRQLSRKLYSEVIDG